MSQIQIKHLTFYYEGSSESVFEDVSFEIDTDWKLGLIGRNGRGKTTLLKLLQGEYEYRGEIMSSAAFDYFPYPITDGKKNVIDIMEELRSDYELWKVCRELTQLGMDAELLYRPYQTLSGGEQVKSMLALLFSEENRFLLIDEPTNHLDQDSRRMVREYLRTKKGYLLVSHDRELLNDCTDHILALNKTGPQLCRGNFDVWWENKNRQDAFEQSENERLRKEIGRLKESVRQTRNWGDQIEASKIGKKSEKYEKGIDTRAYVGEKSRRMQKRRKNLERRREAEIGEKEALLKNIETAETLKLFPLHHVKETLVRIEDLTFGYGDKPLFTDFRLEVAQGERIVLEGANGCGKSTILKWAAGEIGWTEGENRSNRLGTGSITRVGGLKISYVPQDTSFLRGEIRDYIRKSGIDETLFISMLRKLDFPKSNLTEGLENYSEGQKKKVLLAKSLCEQAHLYIWDEPLNYIDLFSRMQIEQVLQEYQPTLLFVEHDRTFVERIATRTIKVL